MYQRILIATDGSALSKKAIRHGIGLAKAAGAELVALTVVPRYPISYFEGAITISADQIARTEAGWAEKAQEVVDGACDAANAEGLKCKAVVARSDLVAESILSAARKNKCDLIVMASHGRKGLKRVLLGSETQQVLTHSQIPVLVLR
ncbi:universal stress protein [Ramlibacter solisilvae]|uniref:Universal stress protein n=1 Tax=Ramlibacter tataouinensis TaxID=94132 RepID=A0A127JY36_9BURK|nr:universal stress protein [Ramlibacter tataouinensis]AMO24753.1 universal stress protein UspA [Ramlibacter tataouinensis]